MYNYGNSVNLQYKPVTSSMLHGYKTHATCKTCKLLHVSVLHVISCTRVLIAHACVHVATYISTGV